jgi:5-oxoprolinase (ATP-hydrolysing)
VRTPADQPTIVATHVDRGGTFTDVVEVWSDGRVTVQKVPSDTAVVGDLGEGRLTFGTTVATNALLERTGARTLALVDEGLADLPHLGDMTRPALFDPDARRPEPLCARAIAVSGRIGSDGTELEPLAFPDPAVLEGFDAVAIVRVNSHVDPVHERRLADWVRTHRPDVFVALGHEVVPTRGLLARLQTTLVHAAFTPGLQTALARDRIPADALAMRSDGTLCPAAELLAPDAILSGPAGGVLAVRAVMEDAGFDQAIGLDMGGTSTDICRVVTGRLPRRTGTVEVGGIPLARDMLAVDTIAAGGGSVLWNDGVRMGVGPRSAGADPGPQCYGRGGPPTLTDAVLALDGLDPDAFDPPLDPARIDLPGDPAAFVALAQEQMAAAVRARLLAEGADARDHVLIGFGGAAGQHVVGVAERLGIDVVLVPAAASVLSAWGQAFASVATVRTVDTLGRPFASLAALVPEGAEVEALVRWSGTTGTLRQPLRATLAEQEEAHRALHTRRFGYPGDGTVEVVALRITVAEPPPGIDPPAVTVTGDRVLHLGTTSVVVPSGWRVQRTPRGLRLDREVHVARDDATASTPFGVALWSARFMAIATAGGAVLRRSARSVNIRERLDFSCAVFDAAGQLVANAPHIPVHLGAMGETVRSLIAAHDPAPGTHWLCNDPAAGGSHLPDLTVVSVGRLGDRPIHVASRAHHVDVGGLTPGSMPPTSRRLADEGEVFRHVLLTDLALLELGSCRQPATVRADLDAQRAANLRMLAELAAVGPPATVHTWTGHILDAGEALVRRWLGTLPNTPVRVADRIDGIDLVLTWHPRPDRLLLDFTGTNGPHPGNLNAPRAVVRAAVLYAVRVLLGTALPLNEGVLRLLDLRIPTGTILDPPRDAAVVGGNVETSMRIADLVFRAAGYAAGSAGTMSNLTLGSEGWSFYETLGGGQGGTVHGPGASARQLHMTNTRATDVEELEHRFPLRVRRFARRRHSGGSGDHPGGDGLVREIEVLESCTVALLATRRTEGAAGLGGDDGVPGDDALCRDGAWAPWDGHPTPLRPGDRVRVGTPGGGGYSEPSGKPRDRSSAPTSGSRPRKVRKASAGSTVLPTDSTFSR